MYYPIFKWIKKNKPIDNHAFPCNAAGTLFLVAGMLICSHVVESSTEDITHRPEGKEGRVI